MNCVSVLFIHCYLLTHFINNSLMVKRDVELQLNYRCGLVLFVTK